MSLVPEYDLSDDESESNERGEKKDRLESSKNSTSSETEPERYIIGGFKPKTNIWCTFSYSSENEDVSYKPKLPSARDVLGTSAVGVLNNPFKVAEEQKIATLEKHVKMVCIFFQIIMS